MIMKLTTKEALQNALIVEKFMLIMYEQFLRDASNPELLELLLSHFAQLADTQHAIFIEMKERDLYPIENAESTKIEEAMQNLKELRKDYSKDFEK